MRLNSWLTVLALSGCSSEQAASVRVQVDGVSRGREEPRAEGAGSGTDDPMETWSVQPRACDEDEPYGIVFTPRWLELIVEKASEDSAISSEGILYLYQSTVDLDGDGARPICLCTNFALTDEASATTFDRERLESCNDEYTSTGADWESFVEVEIDSDLGAALDAGSGLLEHLGISDAGDADANWYDCDDTAATGLADPGGKEYYHKEPNGADDAASSPDDGVDSDGDGKDGVEQIDDDCDGYVDEGSDAFDDDGDCYCEAPDVSDGCVDHDNPNPGACIYADIEPDDGTLIWMYRYQKDCEDGEEADDACEGCAAVEVLPCTMYFVDRDGDEYGANKYVDFYSGGLYDELYEIESFFADDTDGPEVVCECAPPEDGDFDEDYSTTHDDCDDDPSGCGANCCPDETTCSEDTVGNGRDDDCDGDVDDGTDAWDDDGDCYCERGFDDGSGVECSGTVDEVDCDSLRTGDCDDDSADVNPAADEVWYNGVDDNCDCVGLAGESCTDAEVLEADCDQDGDHYVCDPDYYGRPTLDVVLPPCAYLDEAGAADSTPCATFAAEVVLEGGMLDCVDDALNDGAYDSEGEEEPPAAAAINPDAEEKCDEFQVDDNCDGDQAGVSEPTEVDGELTCNGGFSWYYPDADGDGYGSERPEEGRCVCSHVDDDGECNSGGVDGVQVGNDCYLEDNSDCYDLDATVHGLSESERQYETIDGHDNDCDDHIPIVELDCDGDQYFPVVSSAAAQKFPTISSLGLADCRDVVDEDYELAVDSDLSSDLVHTCKDESNLSTPPAPPTSGCREYEALNAQIVCFGRTLVLKCSLETGFLVVDVSTDEEVASHYVYSRRQWEEQDADGEGTTTYEDALGAGDCDDLCDQRRPGLAEGCDGLDNDCSDATLTDSEAYSTTAPVPPAMREDHPRPGTVNRAEADLDRDGYLSCDESTAVTDLDQDQSYVIHTSGQCAGVGANGLGDCNDLCSLSTPAETTEVCNGFALQSTSTCEATDPVDGDRDDTVDCGPYSGIAAENASSPLAAETIYVLAYFPEGLKGAAEELAASRDSADSADSAPQGDSAVADTNSDMPDSNAADTGDEIPSFVPLILPRPFAPECDARLEEELAAQLELTGLALPEEGRAALEEMLVRRRQETEGEGFGVPEVDDLLLELCKRAVEDTESPDTCSVIQLTLTEDADDDLYADQVLSGLDPDSDCDQHPEQRISRSVWSRERILEARRRVLSWDCFRMFGDDGVGCAIGDPTAFDPVDGLQVSVPTLSVDDVSELKGSATWWNEIGRFVDVNATSSIAEVQPAGVLTGCWGEPTGALTEEGGIDGVISADVGGDCDDERASANRYVPEGPEDLLGIYRGLPADCSTCEDGVDNNCNGFKDCAEPACAPCFDGHISVGGCNDEDPCVRSGCATEGVRRDRAPAFVGVLLALLGVAISAARRNIGCR